MSLCILLSWAGLMWNGTYLRVTEVCLSYFKLPWRGKQDPCAVEVVPAYRFKYPDALGYYNLGADKFWVRADQEPTLFGETVAHEYGHHVSFQMFSAQETEGWNAFWKANILAMPGSYAKTSASEGWAECYAVRYVGAKSKYYPPGTKLAPEIAAEVDRLMKSVEKRTNTEPRAQGEVVCRTR